MTYTYEQAIADAPKHVKRRSDLPTEVGWKVCKDTSERPYELRWWDCHEFSVACDQYHADHHKLDGRVHYASAYRIIGWCEPWWGK